MRKIEHIGDGGFGCVDLVEDEDGNKYAQKTFCINQPGGFPEELVENAKKRFIREANIQSEIIHRNIVPVLKKSLDKNPPFFLMPVADASLDKDIAQNRNLHGEFLEAIMDIMSGLEELHSMHIYHRDLKPQNVLRFCNESGKYYSICDFGLMSIKDTQLSVLTRTGMRMGSDFYTAPEIVSDLKQASVQSDIYSVGCILHDFIGTRERLPCNEIDEYGLYADILRCCTRKDPNRRFRSITDLRDMILSIHDDKIHAIENQVEEYINLITSDDPIEVEIWSNIVSYIEDNSLTDDTTLLLNSINIDKINEIVRSNIALANRLAIAYSEWVKNRSFVFTQCDGIANRLEQFMILDDLNVKVEILLALLFMGTAHNRWYVERKFYQLVGTDMDESLAKRFALELRVIGEDSCSKIDHLEQSISVSRGRFHPDIFNTLNKICS